MSWSSFASKIHLASQQDVLEAAAGNETGGFQIMELLLDQRSADIPITVEVVKAAAKNWRSGFQIMKLLLNRRGADIYLSRQKSSRQRHRIGVVAFR
jgi:hypothetical protein